MIWAIGIVAILVLGVGLVVAQSRDPINSASPTPKDYNKRIMHDFLTGKLIALQEQRTMSRQGILSFCQNPLPLLNKTFSSINKDLPLVVVNPCPL